LNFWEPKNASGVYFFRKENENTEPKNKIREDDKQVQFIYELPGDYGMC